MSPTPLHRARPRVVELYEEYEHGRDRYGEIYLTHPRRLAASNRRASWRIVIFWALVAVGVTTMALLFGCAPIDHHVNVAIAKAASCEEQVEYLRTVPVRFVAQVDSRCSGFNWGSGTRPARGCYVDGSIEVSTIDFSQRPPRQFRDEGMIFDTLVHELTHALQAEYVGALSESMAKVPCEYGP